MQKTIVLKGADTVVAARRQSQPQSEHQPGWPRRNRRCPGGAIAGLVAQGLSLRDAAVAGSSFTARLAKWPQADGQCRHAGQRSSAAAARCHEANLARSLCLGEPT